MILDGPLSDLILSKGEATEHLRWEDLFARCQSRMGPAYQVTFPGKAPSLKKGKPDPVHINVAQRAGNKKVDPCEPPRVTNENSLTKVPRTICYIPNFISEEEEQYLLRCVQDAPKPKWTQLSNRRLQNWGGLPHGRGMVPEPIPPWLQTCIKKIDDLAVFGDKTPNHVLVNEYLPGQGIMPHLDGPMYHPIVSTISLGCHTLLDFYKPLPDDASETSGDAQCASFADRHFASVLLQPRSLILVMDEMYTKYLHGIAERTEDVITDKVANTEECRVSSGDILNRATTRVSLTIRHVPKVLKTKLFLGRR